MKEVSKIASRTRPIRQITNVNSNKYVNPHVALISSTDKSHRGEGVSCFFG